MSRKSNWKRMVAGKTEKTEPKTVCFYGRIIRETESALLFEVQEGDKEGKQDWLPASQARISRQTWNMGMDSVDIPTWLAGKKFN